MEQPVGAESAGDAFVVDDYSDRQPWKEWVAEELGRGRPPEELVAGLVAEGWAEGEAEEFVELVRWGTKHGGTGDRPGCPAFYWSAPSSASSNRGRA